MNFNLSGDLAPIGILIMVAFWIMTIVIHVAFSLAVYRDAKLLNRFGTGTVFTGPLIWSWAVLVGGVFVAAIYWVIHHSEFRRIEPVPGNPGPITPEPPTDRGSYRSFDTEDER